MLKLKTDKLFSVPSGRGMIEVIVRLIVSSVSFDKNNVKVNGYYYYLDSDNNLVKLDGFGADSLIQKENLDYLEANILSNLQSNKSTFSNILQRIRELTLMQIEQEAPENYGTYAADWIDDNDGFTEYQYLQ
jgi:predicted nuclease of restriction endonuclease-like RecB superfamily